jgi:hypothetical protein
MAGAGAHSIRPRRRSTAARVTETPRLWRRAHLSTPMADAESRIPISLLRRRNFPSHQRYLQPHSSGRPEPRRSWTSQSDEPGNKTGAQDDDPEKQPTHKDGHLARLPLTRAASCWPAGLARPMAESARLLIEVPPSGCKVERNKQQMAGQSRDAWNPPDRPPGTTSGTSSRHAAILGQCVGYWVRAVQGTSCEGVVDRRLIWGPRRSSPPSPWVKRSPAWWEDSWSISSAVSGRYASPPRLE